MTSRKSSRRAFLAGSLGSLLAACGWDGGPLIRPRLQGFSHFNDWLSQGLFSPGRLARTYDLSERSRSFPAYHISRMTPTLAEPGSWRLEVGGMVERPLSLSLEDLRGPAGLTYTVKHHCVEGWSAIATWTGLPLRVLADMVRVRPEARYVRFDSFDSGFYNGWDLESALHPQTILAYGFNGADLNADHGAPLRVYAPHKLGYKLTKYLTRITFTDERPGGYWEDQGYPWFGGV
ncbi:MAG: molybdopterin-dependent oxidoreductase [Gemmatimonadota bacterium]